MRLKLIFIIISGLVVFLIKNNIENEMVFLSSADKEGNIAQIYWARTFPYLSVNANVRVLDNQWNVIYDENLISNRDHFGDITNEFSSLSWQDKKLVISAKGNYYKGPSVISVLEQSDSK